MVSFLLQMWRFVRPNQIHLWLGILAGFAYAAGTGALMLAVKLVFDAIFPVEGAKTIQQIQHSPLPPYLRDWVIVTFQKIRLDPQSAATLWIIGTVPVAMMFRGMGTFFNTYMMAKLGAKVIHDIRVRIFNHVQSLSVDFFGTSRTGDLISRMTNDTTAIMTTVTNGLGTMAKEPFAVVFLVSYLLFMQPKLSMVALVVFPLVVLPIVIYGKKLRRAWKATQMHTSELSDVIHETFSGVRIVKAYNLEPITSRKFLDTSRKITSQYMRYIRAGELPGPIIEIFGSIGVSLLLVYVARQTGADAPTAGDFSSFAGSLFSLYQPIKNLSRLWGNLEQGRAAGERLFTLLEIQPTVSEKPNPTPITAAGQPIRFDHITFSYGDKAALQDIQLTVQPGQMVALVGTSGSGKTTLTSLLLRFYDPQSGRVKIGNTDLRDVSVVELRNQIAVVTQETVLFNDTIRENIRLGRPNASNAEVEAAARAAQAHEFICAKPDGYGFVVGERGTSLSGGQRQRLAIARALLRDAPILILDEATSALDSESEHAVQAALETLMKGKTTLCIAHRLSTIQRADLIVVMDQGRIIEQGQHAELLALKGQYARLYSLQFRA